MNKVLDQGEYVNYVFHNIIHIQLNILKVQR